MQPEHAKLPRAFKPRNSILGGAFALLAGLLAVYPQSPAKAAESISRDELRADITQTHQLLRDHHPNLSAHISRKDFDALHKRLLNEAGESNTQDEAFFAIAELVASVCDEHTRIITGKADRVLLPDGWPWYEFPLVVDDGRLFMEEFQTGKTEEVLSIDGIAGPDIVAALAARSPNDGCLGDATLVINEALSLYGSLIGKMIGYDGPYKVRTKAPDSRTVTERTVRAAGHFVSTTHRSHFRKQQDRIMRTGLLVDGFRQQHLGFAVGEAGLDYRYSERHNAAYLGVDSFKTPEKAEKGVELVMRDIIQKNPDRLIVDLVDNSGGATKTARQVLAFLLPRSHRLHHRVRVKNVKKIARKILSISTKRRKNCTNTTPASLAKSSRSEVSGLRPFASIRSASRTTKARSPS